MPILKVIEFNQQTKSIQAKRHLLKMQSLANQFNDEFGQIIWPDHLNETIDADKIEKSIQFLRNAISNVLSVV